MVEAASSSVGSCRERWLARSAGESWMSSAMPGLVSAAVLREHRWKWRVTAPGARSMRVEIPHDAKPSMREMRAIARLVGSS